MAPLGFVPERSGYYVSFGVYNTIGELSQKEFNQLQHWLPKKSIESSCAAHIDRKWTLVVHSGWNVMCVDVPLIASFVSSCCECIAVFSIRSIIIRYKEKIFSIRSFLILFKARDNRGKRLPLPLRRGMNLVFSLCEGDAPLFI